MYGSLVEIYAHRAEGSGDKRCAITRHTHKHRQRPNAFQRSLIDRRRPPKVSISAMNTIIATRELASNAEKKSSTNLRSEISANSSGCYITGTIPTYIGPKSSHVIPDRHSFVFFLAGGARLSSERSCEIVDSVANISSVHCEFRGGVGSATQQTTISCLLRCGRHDTRTHTHALSSRRCCEAEVSSVYAASAELWRAAHSSPRQHN